MALPIGALLAKLGDLFSIAAYLFGATLWMKTRGSRFLFLDNNLFKIVGASMLWGLAFFLRTISGWTDLKPVIDIMAYALQLVGASVMYLSISSFTSNENEKHKGGKRK